MAGTDDGERTEDINKEGEGHNLLGQPTFVQLENGRFKCVETGHELPPHGKADYARSKHCRLGLIDAAVAHNKPPLNMFSQDPQSRSKLICKLTGVTINKSEEHIWKHINGKRFLRMLEKKEAELENADGSAPEPSEQNQKKKVKIEPDGLKPKKKKLSKKSSILSELRDPKSDTSDSEEVDFWMPPVGERWDSDDGGDRWGSASESELQNEEIDREVGEETEEGNHETGELSKRTKRMSLEIGPSSFASRKKKKVVVAT